jgi:hypothetical protein
MSVYDPTTETAVESTDKNNDPVITGPHWEDPDLVANATTYWRCSECGYESIREKDLDRASFHAEGCAGHES